ncbi:competence protein ComK [Oceanobacillus halotolerans]|uniref:competence protein ComK n=1 Tax=Oceanobacillus halotolerans TaxID=2663380 RepID=UPI001CF7A558
MQRKEAHLRKFCVISSDGLFEVDTKESTPQTSPSSLNLSFDKLRGVTVQILIKRTGFTRKVPIPINPDQHLYTFPTDHVDCSWIFYLHVLQINASANNPKQSMIRFTNGETLTLHLSPYILRKQLKRTLVCVSFCNWSRV